MTILRRLMDTMIVLVITSILVFAMVRLIPGDPAALAAGPDASPEQLEAIRSELGLDKPIPVQYLIWIGNVVTGDFGQSITARRPVSEVIARRIPLTLQMAAGGLLMTVLIGFAGGIVAGLNRGGKVDWFVSLFNIGALAIPTFWSGVLLILVFGLWLDWLPVGGGPQPGDDLWTILSRLVLPSVTLGLTLGPELAWFVRNGILETRGEDYIRTAYAKGIRRWRFVSHHLLKNGLLPVITILGVQLGSLLSSAVVVEAVFVWPGLGTLGVQSIVNRDYAVVQAVILLFVVMQSGANLLADFIYILADPRARTS